MHWKIIGLGTKIFGRYLFASNFSYFLQRYVLHQESHGPKNIETGTKELASLIDKFTKYSKENISNIVLLEIGAGKNLFRSFMFYCLGINHQILFDIHRLIQPKRVNDVISLFKNNKHERLVRYPTNTIGKDIETDLLKHYGISYNAPVKLFSYGIQDKSVDLIETRSTLEHVPLEDLKKNLNVFYRVLRDDGLMTHYIDYTDHYYFYDSGITPYNFLKFNSKRWAFYNSKYHYQNRLHHSDYEKLFTDTGFEIIESHAFIPTTAQSEFSQIKISPIFQDYKLEDLLTTRGILILKKSNGQSGKGAKINTNYHRGIDSFVY